MKTYIRRAVLEDIEKIMIIIEMGRKFLQQQGLSQWQDGYGPNEEAIRCDILKDEGYVLVYEEQFCGYAAAVSGEDPCYTEIKQGQWDSGYEEYVSLHRVAVDSTIRGRGLGKIFLLELIKQAKELGYSDVRIDTHPGNLIMQRVIVSAGFRYCGVIQFPIPDGERKAYQVIVNKNSLGLKST